MNFREELKKMKNQVNKIGNERKSIATQIIEDKKRAIRVLLIVIILLICCVFYCIALLEKQNARIINFIDGFDYQATEIDSGNGIATYIENGMTGDINY